MTLNLLTLLLPSAMATVPDTYGIGAANIGRGSAMTAVADDPFATYYNPAGLGQLKKPTVNVGYIMGQANLLPFQAIVYDTNGDGLLTDADGYPDRGPVGTDYSVRDPGQESGLYTSGIQSAMAFPLFDQWLLSRKESWLANRRMTMGMSVFLPTTSFLRMEMEDPYMPYYVMFRNRNNRFALFPALGFQLMQGVYAGVGSQMMFESSIRLRLSSYTTVDSFPSDSGEGEDLDVRIQADVQDFVLELKPTQSYNWGVLLRPAEIITAFQKVDGSTRDKLWWNVLSHTAFGVTGRGEWGMSTSADVTVLANGEVHFDDETLLLSALLEEPVEVQLTDMRSMYNPPELAFGLSTGVDLGKKRRTELGLALDATRTAWSKFTETTPPYQEMTVEALAGSSVTIQSGSDYGDPGFKDTVSVRSGMWVSQDWTGSNKPGHVFVTTLRGGYGFVPSPVPDQTGLTNYMDSDRHLISGGLGLHFFPKASAGPVDLDFAGQYQKLVTRTVQKDPSLITDTDGDGFLNYPRGYPLEGQITSGGSVWVIAATATVQFGFVKPRPSTQDSGDVDPGNPAHGLLNPVSEDTEPPPAPPAPESSAPEAKDTPAAPAEPPAAPAPK